MTHRGRSKHTRLSSVVTPCLGDRTHGPHQPPFSERFAVWRAFYLRCVVRARVRLGELEAAVEPIGRLLSPLGGGGSPALAAFGALEALFVSWLRDDAAAFSRTRREFAPVALASEVPVLWRCLAAFNGDEFDGNLTPQIHDVVSALVLACDSPDPVRARELAMRALEAADDGPDVALSIAARVVAIARNHSGAPELAAQVRVLASSMPPGPVTASVSAFQAGDRDIGYYQPFLNHITRATGNADDGGVPPRTHRGRRFDGNCPRDGERIKTSEGTLQLVVLLALHGEATRDRLVDCLWPELDGDSATSSAKNVRSPRSTATR